jgi:NAD(P)H-flavin reductase
MNELEQAIEMADPNKVNIYYVGWSLGKPLDKEMLEEWLKSIKPYVDNGTVKWVTLPEMYDAYIEWEKDNR